MNRRPPAGRVGVAAHMERQLDVPEASSPQPLVEWRRNLQPIT